MMTFFVTFACKCSFLVIIIIIIIIIIIYFHLFFIVNHMIVDGHLIFLRAMCEYVWVDMITLSPLRLNRFSRWLSFQCNSYENSVKGKKIKNII